MDLGDRSEYRWAIPRAGARAQIEFGSGNPQYIASVRNGLLCLLSSPQLPAQRIAAQVINGFISPDSPSYVPAEVFNYSAAFVPAIVAMLSCEVSASYEALKMLEQLVRASSRFVALTRAAFFR